MHRMKSKKMYDYLYYKPLIHKFLVDIKDKYKDNLISIVLFGSVVRGNGRKESDIDLLVILDDTSDIYYDRLKPLVDIELKMRESAVYERYIKEGVMPCFSYLVFSIKEAEENHYVFLDMVEEAIILYDKNNYFKRRLSVFSERLSTMGSKKLSLEDGSWYWDLKSDLRMGDEFIL